MEYWIGIDIGTTSAKIVAFSKTGGVIKKIAQSYPIKQPQADFSEQDPLQILNSVTKGLKKLVSSQSGVHSLQGIGFSSAMHSLILLDSSGNPLTPCIIWADNRSAEQAHALSLISEGKNIFQQTGTPIHPMSPLCKIRWFRENCPELFEKTRIFTGIKEFILFQWTGKHRMDWSLASATGLLDIRTKQWASDALQYAGISETQLPELVDPYFLIPDIKSEILKEIGILESPPVVIGASDGCLANLGSGALEKGILAVTIGTSGAARIAVPDLGATLPEGLFTYILDGNTFIRGGASNNGGIILSWMADLLFEDKADADHMEAFMESAEQVSPGSDGLLFLPFLLGERAPVWNEKARGIFWGLDIRHNKSHFIRAVLEGITLNMTWIIRNISKEVPIRQINASGGFSQSSFWLQLLADISGLEVLGHETPEASAWGAVLMCMKSTGALEQYSENKLQNSVRYTPDFVLHDMYQKKLDQFSALYYKLKD